MTKQLDFQLTKITQYVLKHLVYTIIEIVGELNGFTRSTGRTEVHREDRGPQGGQRSTGRTEVHREDRGPQGGQRSTAPTTLTSLG